MEFLKLSNTEECLKLAECLIGSPCFYPKTTHGINLYGSDLKYGFATNPYMDTSSLRWRNGTLWLPLETIKLNPFKCMEHGVKVIVNDHRIYPKIGSMYGERLNLHNLSHQIRWIHRKPNISLDLNKKLPTGASIVEIEE